jgi:hypothetical protein
VKPTDPRRLLPRRGTPILRWWRSVVEWALTLPVVIGPNVLATSTPLGMKVTIRSQNPVRTPFRVGVRARQIRVSIGTVDDEVPWIAMDRSGLNGNVRLDGTREGTLEPVPVGTVRYELAEDDGPGPDGRSFVVIAANLQTMRDLELTSPGLSAQTLRIEHHPELTPAIRNTARLARGTAYHTLAVLYWSTDRARIERVGQVTHHHLKILVDGDGVGFYVAT